VAAEGGAVTDPQRRRVRVRRSPKVGVFLLIGAVVGVVAAIVIVNVGPDSGDPTAQAIGFLAVLLGALGALLGGLVALVLDAVSERRARTVDAERIAPPAAPPAAPRSAEDRAEPAADEPTADARPSAEDRPDRS
jgi:hypothetical protein